MLKMFIGTVLALSSARAQAFEDLLLPQARHITGTVVDAQERPIAQARIDHSNDRWGAHQTNSQGIFELDTRAPTLVVRKAGFRSEVVRTKDAGNIKITLNGQNQGKQFPTCATGDKYYGIASWGSSFQFLKIPEVTASRQGHDVDYGVRTYYVKTKQGAKGIMHGSGPQWSFGTPSDREVWGSTRYEEVTYDSGDPLMIIDARGQLPNGKRWRYLGQFGESASYSDTDEATARILDRFLDGACLKPSLMNTR